MALTTSETLYLETDLIYDLDENERTCYLNSNQIKRIGVNVGDYVKITGSRSTVTSCRLWSRYVSPLKTNSIGVTRISSESAGAPALGATVSVRRVEVQPAKEILLSSYSAEDPEFVSLLNSSNLLRWRLIYSALTKGDYITLKLVGDSETSMLKLHFQIMNISPADAAAVYVDEETVFKVLLKANVEIEERIVQRETVLERLYQLTTNGQRWVDGIGLGVELGFDFSDMKEILSYLRREKLIEPFQIYSAFIDSEYPTVLKISISHKGRKKVESARLNSSKGTRHFRNQIYNIASANMEIDLSTHNQSLNNINDSNIIVDSKVENTSIKLKKIYGEDLVKYLNVVKQAAQESKDPSVSLIFDELTKELIESKPDKSRRNKLLDGLERLLPLASTSVAIYSQIRNLLP